MHFVDFFRDTAPYIHAHRKKTIVLMVSGEALDHANSASLIHDIALLTSLRIRVVLVFGARPQIDRTLNARKVTCEFKGHMRVTNADVLATIQEVHGTMRAHLEAQLSMGLINSPMHNAQVRVVSGNFVTAKPMGVLDGVDLLYSGEVRKVDSEAVAKLLADDYLVLVPHTGYSPTGEMFNLSAHDVAVQMAVGLGADKLFIIGDDQLVNPEGQRLGELVPSQCLDILAKHQVDEPGYQDLEAAMLASRYGVPRCHLVGFQHDGGILSELYTRDGTGTLITQEPYDTIRPAKTEDVGGILELLKPLEESGVLVRRSRERLETEIQSFLVNERDGMIIGCIALYPFDTDSEPDTAEVACVAVRPDYRANNRGDRLLTALEDRARAMGIQSLFLLTTHTAHWFIERGFEQVDLSALPQQRQNLYNYQRNSKVFRKPLAGN